VISLLRGIFTQLRTEGAMARASVREPNGTSYDLNPGPAMSGARYIGQTVDATTRLTASFLAGENVRAYQVLLLPVSGSVSFLKVAEDAIDDTQADLMLADPPASATASIDHYRQAAGPAGALIEGEWQELSKSPADASLLRLDVQAVGSTPVIQVFVRTR